MNITMQDMLKAGVHFGHQTRYWNPKMAPYIYGARNKIHIIDLGKSLPLLSDAVNVISNIAANKGKVLFVGTKFAAQSIIKEEAERCGMPFVDCRWLGGMLTNYKTIRQSIKRLKDLEAMFESGKFGRLNKKEILGLEREKNKLTTSIGGIKNMGGLPDALFVIDVGYEKIAIKEANRLGIPVIGVVDSNNDPEDVSYIIPGNDDSTRSIRFYAKLMADTIMDARTSALEGIEEDFIEVAESAEAPKKEEKKAKADKASDEKKEAKAASKPAKATAAKSTEKKAASKTTAKSSSKTAAKSTEKSTTAKTAKASAKKDDKAE